MNKLYFIVFASLFAIICSKQNLYGQIQQTYPASPYIFIGNDTIISLGDSINLSASFFATNETSSYNVTPIIYSPPVPFSVGIQLGAIDDMWSSVLDLSFNFCFYNTYYHDVILSANGILSFDTSSAEGYSDWSFSNSLPSQSLQKNAVFGTYVDLDASQSGALLYYTAGTGTSRIFVYNVNGVALFSCNTPCTQQIILYETTNVIEVYLQDKPSCSTWNSGNSLIGIQDSLGLTGISPPGRNTGDWIANNEAWRFTPNGNKTYSINWYDTIGTLIDTGASIIVMPFDTTSYIGEMIIYNCNDTVHLYDTITVYPITNVNINKHNSYKVSIFPNPTSSIFYIEGINIETIEIRDIKGRLIQQKIPNAEKTSINLTGQAKGIYLIKIIGKENVVIKKIIFTP